VAESPLELEVISLPEINLTDDSSMSLSTVVVESSEVKDFAKLAVKEAEELRQAQAWLISQQAACSADFVSDTQIASLRATTTKEIKDERNRVITFMANVKARFNRFKQAYKMGKITR